jgi:hypothetical protein
MNRQPRWGRLFLTSLCWSHGYSSRCVMPKTRDLQWLRILGLCLTGIDSLPRHSPIETRCPATPSRRSISALLQLNLLLTSLENIFPLLCAPPHLGHDCQQVKLQPMRDVVKMVNSSVPTMCCCGYVAPNHHPVTHKFHQTSSEAFNTQPQSV